jgi:hypothetical protein
MVESRAAMTPVHDTTGLSMPHTDVRLLDGRLVRVGSTGADYLIRMARERCVPRGDVTAWAYGGQRGTVSVGSRYAYIDRLVDAGLLRYRWELTPEERQRTRSQAMVEITDDGDYAVKVLTGEEA